MTPAPPPLILASASPYRRELLSRLQLPFRSEKPGVDEAGVPNERPAALAVRLAVSKAKAVAARNRGAVVVGSDQVAELDGRSVGKPGTVARAIEQLTSASGRVVIFHTAVALVRADGAVAQHTDVTRVRFRPLSPAEIERYVALDEPLDCAGSFRSEARGVALFESIETADPTALVGLPLIWLSGALRGAGLDPLAAPA